MTVKISKPALNLREELTKAQSVVPYSQQQFWMDGLVENGTFDSDTGWTKYGDAVISNGVATLDGATGTAGLYQDILTLGKTYYYAFTISAITGTLQLINNDGLSLASYTTTGTKTLSWTHGIANGNFLLRTNGGANTATLDNVAVFEVDENDNVIHSLPLGFKPLHVYEDGLIQREGDVHDYTVVKTGGAYAIKPTVQPTGATETCVIAEREL